MIGHRIEPNKQWTKEEDDFLKSNYGTLGAKVCAERLGRKVDAVYQRVSHLGCTRYFRGPRLPVEMPEAVTPKPVSEAVKSSDFIAAPSKAKLMGAK